MPLQTTTDIYAKALAGNYAIGGFIAYNLEMFQALVRAANAARSPLLLQSSAQAVDYAGFGYLIGLARAAAEEAETPVAYHLDHGFSVEICKAAVDAGFTSVMIDASSHPLEENIRITREVVEYAHDNGVVVEGELGSPENDRAHTHPDQVAEYVARTGIDSLAIAIGNSHGQMQLDAPPMIDFELAEAIRKVVPTTPLVLHALTIIPDGQPEAYKAAGGQLRPVSMVSEEVFIQAAHTPGICKLNIGISLKLEMMTAIREYLAANPTDFDPRKPFGFARQRLEKLIGDHLRRIGSAGRA